MLRQWIEHWRDNNVSDGIRIVRSHSVRGLSNTGSTMNAGVTVMIEWEWLGQLKVTI